MSDPGGPDPVVAAALAGDDQAFAAVAQRHHRELHVHCYRMLASYEEAEDAVQEALLRAWSHRARIAAGGGNLRAWLYRVCTNVCLDQIRRRRRRPITGTAAEVAWLQPYPDALLDEAAAADDGPDATVIDRETIELTFLVALQALPPRQRAALIARDVLGWSAVETAEALETTVAAANSAVQRARATLQQRLPERRADWSAPEVGAAERDLLARFVRANDEGDAALALACATEDIRITMPPAPAVFTGLDDLRTLLERAFGPEREGDWRALPTRANRLPAAGSYLRRPGDTRFRAFKLDVIRVEGERIAEITTFGWSHFARFGLPPELPGV
ncbi:RNA polymerase subunit sigma-70 [Iamia sp. SCSIO 61187]|uniref:RNA polymerase subunit sigma-70 n=1 Tax=Iamia sp. SCSIO 61187 TaxID=2722752 RepID=UPI001C62BF4D|nr:RNA polymerase subunit sigma-70 [Iamia sp. SCSIO 61187]QYG94997.1 RNA polymerase subunit sigma-70 [Iamia sp. SCSIO 61187]